MFGEHAASRCTSARWSIARPDAGTIARVVDARRDADFTYSDVGATREGEMPAGYAIDRNREYLGRGVFASARSQLRAWRMMPPWTAAEPAQVPIEEGRVFVVLVNALGMWWINPARIVYVIDEPRRFGFAYGTLPGHAESGEERFLVEELDDGAVWYDVSAFSRPRFWGARVAYPLTRALQKQFARDSRAAMLRALR
jgi:uncharacterized protein (UPF0548 family)